MGVMADQAMVITNQATDQAMVAPAISRVAVALAIMGTGDLSTIDFEPHDTFQKKAFFWKFASFENIYFYIQTVTVCACSIYVSPSSVPKK